jgi:predicted alpha/beta superfamily hydrolase
MKDGFGDSGLQTVTWRNYYKVFPRKEGHQVAGTIKIAQDVESPRLGNKRDIMVYLPPSYAHSERHYPVLYMHDGQNLFDPATSFAGEWHVDETMESLAYEDDLEAIVVGIPNAGPSRLDEYSPFVDPTHGGGEGNHYVAFIANTVKPLIDHHFRTLPQRRQTGIMGSSMGGLISLYAFFRREDVFGFAGVMSPSLWFARGSIYGYVENASCLPGRIYLDAGTREMGGSRINIVKRIQSRHYYAGVRRMKRILINKGYRPVRDILHVEEKWANHNEAAWARRLPEAIRFFIRGQA